jgi:hypothetical protein
MWWNSGEQQLGEEERKCFPYGFLP